MSNITNSLEAAQKAWEQQKAQLDADAAEMHRKNKELAAKGEKGDFSKLPEFEKRREDLKQEEQRITRERWLKEDYKLKFMAGGVATEADWERLWETRLRDEALISLANGTYKPSANSHPAFSWDESLVKS